MLALMNDMRNLLAWLVTHHHTYLQLLWARDVVAAHKLFRLRSASICLLRSMLRCL